MKCRVLKTLKVKTIEGILEVRPGRVIEISSEKAAPFIENGKISPVPEMDPGGFPGSTAGDIRKDWRILWNETLGRIDKIYELGDLERLKQDEPFYERLMKIEAAMEQSILNGRGYEEAIRRFDECIREGLSKLRRGGDKA